MAAARGGGGIVALFKRGWNEIPEIIGSSFMALIGLGLTGAAIYNYNRKDLNNRKFKFEYIVMRHDDPRAARVRTGPDG